MSSPVATRIGPDSALPDGMPTDAQHFTMAVAKLGESHPVIASKAIFNAKGIKIIDKGATINLGLYERLMQHQLAEPIENSVTSTFTVTGQRLRSNAEEVLASTPFFARMTENAQIRRILLDAIETLPLPDPMAFQLTLACEIYPEIYRRALCAALTAAWLAHSSGGSRFDICMAAAAGLLHDVGLLHVDPMLFQSKESLSRTQLRQLYAHPLVSNALIERHHQYTKEVVRAVLEHHEYLDGSGYPRNLVGSAISDLGRILSLAEVVTAMFMPGQEASELRLSVILRMNLHRYDPALVVKLMCLIKPELDVMSAGISLLQEPVERLIEIDHLIADWPAGLMNLKALSAPRREGLERLAAQVSQLHRALATVGVAPEQLAQIGSDSLDDMLKQELTLLAGEAAWQLRALARQTRRRWRLTPDETYPDELLLWLDQVEALVTDGANDQTPEEIGNP
jgi:hypothetical protein